MESLTEQQSKMDNNTEKISTLSEEVGTNQADVSDLETKMEEQKSETRELIGGVFGNLSGVIVDAVYRGVIANVDQLEKLEEKMEEKLEEKMEEKLEEKWKVSRLS